MTRAGCEDDPSGREIDENEEVVDTMDSEDKLVEGGRDPGSMLDDDEEEVDRSDDDKSGIEAGGVEDDLSEEGIDGTAGCNAGSMFNSEREEFDKSKECIKDRGSIEEGPGGSGCLESMAGLLGTADDDP